MAMITGYTDHKETWTVYDASGNEVYKQTDEGWEGNSLDEYAAISSLAEKSEIPEGDVEWNQTFDAGNALIHETRFELMLRPHGEGESLMVGTVDHTRECEPLFA